jgi:hypothetical protein
MPSASTASVVPVSASVNLTKPGSVSLLINSPQFLPTNHGLHFFSLPDSNDSL